MYTVRELRTKLKEALDLAEKGETVEIIRNHIKFTISKMPFGDPSPVMKDRYLPTVNESYRKEPFVPAPPDPATGYPCCQKENYRCKHWNWDDTVGAWKNSLTGLTKVA